MNDSIKAFWLGLFIILTVAIAAWLLLFLSPNVGDCGNRLHVRFSNIQSISLGTRVTFAGKPVGEVVHIEAIPDARSLPPDSAGNDYFYELTLCVDSSVHVYSYDEILFSNSGLMGERSIAIFPRATPAGHAPAQDITHQILYARASDELQQALAKLSDVADTFQQTLSRLNEFLDDNMHDFHKALIAFGSLIEEARTLQLVPHLNEASLAIGQTLRDVDAHILPHLSSTLERLSRGEGSLGRLLTQDTFYLQSIATLSKLETVLSDMSRYGMLFQFDRCWQRKRALQEYQMRKLCSPDAAFSLLNFQVAEVAETVERVEKLFHSIPEEADQSFEELLGRIDHLHSTLKAYREMLFENYCEACH